jgi:phage shock protein E
MKSWLARVLSMILPSPPDIAPGEDVVFVDVRSHVEFAGGRVKGAHHIPLEQIKTRWKEIRRHKDRRILLYCRSGHRSGIATRMLRTYGFTRAENAGGIGALKRAGIELE